MMQAQKKETILALRISSTPRLASQRPLAAVTISHTHLLRKDLVVSRLQATRQRSKGECETKVHTVRRCPSSSCSAPMTPVFLMSTTNGRSSEK